MLLMMSSMALAAQLATPITTQWPGAIEQWRSLIEPNARLYGIDPALVAAMIQTESGGDPAAYRYEAWADLESVGLMQIVTFPWRNVTAGQLYDPGFNVAYGTRLYATVLRQADDDHRLALGLWNCGAAGLETGRCGKWGGYRYADAVLKLCYEYGGCLLPPFMDRRR